MLAGGQQGGNLAVNSSGRDYESLELLKILWPPAKKELQNPCKIWRKKLN